MIPLPSCFEIWFVEFQLKNLKILMDCVGIWWNPPVSKSWVKVSPLGCDKWCKPLCQMDYNYLPYIHQEIRRTKGYPSFLCMSKDNFFFKVEDFSFHPSASLAPSPVIPQWAVTISPPILMPTPLALALLLSFRNTALPHLFIYKYSHPSLPH